jgi:hypothetical protein
MNKAGRPRKPAVVKMAQGTYRKDREPVYKLQGDTISEVPDVEFTNPHEQEYFNRTCQILIDNGWLLRDFMDDIKRAAFWHGLYMEHKDKDMVQTTQSGYTAMTASFSIMKEAHKNICDFENRYGLNLLYSQRFSKKDKTEEDPFHKLLNAK